MTLNNSHILDGKKSFAGPNRHGAHQGRWIIKKGLSRRGQIGPSAVADGDQHIAHETVAADAFDRRSGEDVAEGGIVQRRQIGQTRRGQFDAGAIIGFPGRLGELVPGTDAHAIVAAIDAVASRGRRSRGMWPLYSIVR